MDAPKNVIAASVVLSLALGMMPAAAFASENGETPTDAGHGAAAALGSDAQSAVGDAMATTLCEPDGLPESFVDKQDYYLGSETDALLSLLSVRAAGLQPCVVSKNMLYFGAYEGGSYDATFGYGDGYHAMGYYQFDHRYGLKDFLLACRDYDPSTYGMFAQFADVSDAAFTSGDAIRQDGAFTELGRALIDAWKAAYAADPEGFSRLQDGWAYQQYYEPAERYLASRGIDISDRNDAVKGLCWGLSNLFGTSGWKKFVGGYSSGYDWNGDWQEWCEWPGAGLNNEMTDTEFVSTLCNYVAANVGVFYKAQPQYHEGWQNRYKKEKAQCLSIIAETGDSRAPSDGGSNEGKPDEPDLDNGELGDGSPEVPLVKPVPSPVPDSSGESADAESLGANSGGALGDADANDKDAFGDEGALGAGNEASGNGGPGSGSNATDGAPAGDDVSLQGGVESGASNFVGSPSNESTVSAPGGFVGGNEAPRGPAADAADAADAGDASGASSTQAEALSLAGAVASAGEASQSGAVQAQQVNAQGQAGSRADSAQAAPKAQDADQPAGNQSSLAKTADSFAGIVFATCAVLAAMIGAFALAAARLITRRH